MAKLTVQKKFGLALLRRGYVLSKPTSRFEVMVPGENCRRVLRSDVEHKILLGSSGALRWTRKNVGESHNFSDKMRALLLSEVSEG